MSRRKKTFEEDVYIEEIIGRTPYYTIDDGPEYSIAEIKTTSGHTFQINAEYAKNLSIGNKVKVKLVL